MTLEPAKISRRALLRVGLIGGASIGLSGGSWIGRASTLKEGDALFVNQTSYGQYWPKFAALMPGRPGKRTRLRLSLVEASTGRVVKHMTAPLVHSENREGLQSASVDFSGVHEIGRFYLKSGPIESVPFQITERPFEGLKSSLLEAITMQRCGVDVRSGNISHSPCHVRLARHIRGDGFAKEGEKRDVHGGWHDAGDYGKYVATTALTIGCCLSGLSGEALSDPVNKALLNEMQVGLDWLLKMQRADGAFYRKVGPAEWPPLKLAPEDDIGQQYVYGVSTPDSAKAVAALAIGARTFAMAHQDSEPYQNAAVLGINYLQNNPEPHADNSSEDQSGSGLYLSFDEDGNLQDARDRLWADIEVALLLGDQREILSSIRQAKDEHVSLISWADPLSLGYLNLLRHKGLPSRHTRSLKRSVLAQSVNYAAKAHRNSFGVAHSDFVWGSNRLAASAAIILLRAYKMTGQRTFLNAALIQANYLLGANPHDMSFVTGIGTKSPLHVHNRLSQSRDLIIPGQLVGGPNGDQRGEGEGSGPLGYSDKADAYQSNEFAIEYNAVFIQLLSDLETIEPDPPRRSLLDRLFG